MSDYKHAYKAKSRKGIRGFSKLKQLIRTPILVLVFYRSQSTYSLPRIIGELTGKKG